MNRWVVLVAVLLVSVIGCGGGGGPSEAEIAAIKDASFWKGLGLFIGVTALVIGVVVGVTAAKRGESIDKKRDDRDPTDR